MRNDLLSFFWFLGSVLITKWHSVVTLTYGLMDGLGYLKPWNAECSWVEMGFMGHVCLSAWTDMWALNRREGSWKDVWIAVLLHSALWCHIWVPHSHLNNAEMINGKTLWPFKPCRETPGWPSCPTVKETQAPILRMSGCGAVQPPGLIRAVDTFWLLCLALCKLNLKLVCFAVSIGFSLHCFPSHGNFYFEVDFENIQQQCELVIY